MKLNNHYTAIQYALTEEPLLKKLLSAAESKIYNKVVALRQFLIIMIKSEFAEGQIVYYFSF